MHFIKAALSKYDQEVFNLGSGKPRSINTLAKLIHNKYTHIPWRPGEPKVTHADIKKLKKMLNWIKDIIGSWYKSYFKRSKLLEKSSFMDRKKDKKGN